MTIPFAVWPWYSEVGTDEYPMLVNAGGDDRLAEANDAWAAGQQDPYLVNAERVKNLAKHVKARP